MKINHFDYNIPQSLLYTVYTPKNYDASQKYPMIVSLHGAGERGDGTENGFSVMQNIGLPRYFRDGLMEIPCIVLAPQCPDPYVWNQLIFTLKALIEKVAAEYNADPDRISITGMSMGGFGTWEMAMAFPDMFSAIAPICGGGMAWRAPALNGMPIWAFHGNEDGVVSITNSQEMVKAARVGGADVKFTIFDGINHNSWDSAYLDTNLVQWLISKKRTTDR